MNINLITLAQDSVNVPGWVACEVVPGSGNCMFQCQIDMITFMLSFDIDRIKDHGPDIFFTGNLQTIPVCLPTVCATMNNIQLLNECAQTVRKTLNLFNYGRVDMDIKNNVPKPSKPVVVDLNVPKPVVVDINVPKPSKRRRWFRRFFCWARD